MEYMDLDIEWINDYVADFEHFLFFFQSRAALSLLGYCYFQVQSFDAASDW